MKSLTKAKENLSYYFQTVWEKAGLKWTSDNQIEVEEIVDALCDAIKRDIEKSSSKSSQD